MTGFLLLLIGLVLVVLVSRRKLEASWPKSVLAGIGFIALLLLLVSAASGYQTASAGAILALFFLLWVFAIAATLGIVMILQKKPWKTATPAHR
jgi:peptidoglycan/LPS O-acetylase OafA/YrhL